MALSANNCVFLVDDDEDDQFLVQQVLRQHSPESEVRSLHDGEALLQALQESKSLPSLVLLDLNMPYMGGFEALQAIRDNQRYSSLPIVILTTSDQVADKERARELRADDFITKPVTVEQYAQVVRQLKSRWL